MHITLHYIYAFSRRFYPKWLTFRLYIFFFFFISMCSLGIEPTTFCAANAMLYTEPQTCIIAHTIWFPAVCMYVCYNQKENSVEVPVSEKTIYTSEMLWIRFLNQLHFVSSNPRFQYRIYAKVLTVVEKWNLHNSIGHCSSHMVKIIYCNPQMVLACLNVETPTK